MSSVRQFFVSCRIPQARHCAAFALKFLSARAAGTSANAAVAKDANTSQEKKNDRNEGGADTLAKKTKLLDNEADSPEINASSPEVGKIAVHMPDKASLKTGQSDRLPLHQDGPLPKPAADGTWVASEKIQQLVEQIASLSILEVADLNKALKKKLNLSDAPVMTHAVVASAVPSAQESKSASEKDDARNVAEKTFFTVKLTKFDAAKKIALIKEVRTLVQGLNLVQAKKFVESLPAVIKEDLSKKDADELKAKIEKIGGVCEIV